MTEFTASNSYRIELSGGAVSVHNVSGHERHVFGRYTIEALREFFQHERDEELGRWRWPENPDYVVYPMPDGRARVLRDTDGMFFVWARSDSARTVDREDAGGAVRAACAFFEAHPERKPWEDAKDGEIWEFTLGCSKGQYLAEGGRFFLLPLRTPSEPGWKPASFARDFEQGKRIWAEDAS